MAGVSTVLSVKLEQAGLGERTQEYLPIFQGVIDMQATVELNADAFEKHLKYMEDHVAQYAVELPDSTSRWVPVDFIKHIYKSDKNFRFRLGRFLKGLTRNYYRVEDDEVVFELEAGNVGNAFLSWDMTLTLFLHEGKSTEAKGGKVPANEAPLVQQVDVEMEEDISEIAEASMALVLLQRGESEPEEPDSMLGPNEVLDAVPELDVTTLYPIIVDGKEFLFLDDIEKTLGLREDEALSILANGAGVLEEAETSERRPRVQIDFDDQNLTKALAFRRYDAEHTIEENVAAAIVAIQDVAQEYESVPENAFQPHKPQQFHTLIDHGGKSIDIMQPQLVDADDDVEVGQTHAHHVFKDQLIFIFIILLQAAFMIDKFAARIGGVRGLSEGRDTSLMHYIHSLSPSILRVFHLDYSEDSHAEILKCKVLSNILCEDPVANNANKCILVNRDAALYVFAGSYTGHILSHCAASMSQGVNCPRTITDTIGKKAIQGSTHAENITELLKKM